MDAITSVRYELGLPVSEETLSYLLANRSVQRLVTLMDVCSLSTLELIEHGLTKEDIRFSFVNGVTELDPRYAMAVPDQTIVSLLVDGKYDFWNRRKFRLSGLGLFLLGCLEGCQARDLIRKAQSQ